MSTPNRDEKRPWFVIGTVPDDSLPLLEGACALEPGTTALGVLTVAGTALPIRRGTPALLAACCIAAGHLGIAPPRALLAGDTGRGEGSRVVYDHLAAHLPQLAPAGLTFHYLFPDLGGHDHVFFAARSLPRPPLLVADAGFMYAAKMSGQARDYDLFTPDAGELAFLADELAPHPFYTRGFLLAEGQDPAVQAHQAWRTGGAARHLLIKGDQDLVAREGEIVRRISSSDLCPGTPAMEAIGGTGDTLTGMATALLMAGYEIIAACAMAALANRLLGQLARPTPATPVSELIPFIPEALGLVLQQE